ncbi:hypothetical protein Trydic_g17116 [Trypoxylus dichotomus]
MLYAAPVWVDPFRVKESRKLIGVQRISAVRGTGACATTPPEAAAAISGIPLADIQAKRRDTAKNDKGIIAEMAGREIYSRDIENVCQLVSETHSQLTLIDTEGECVQPNRITIYTNGSRSDHGTGPVGSYKRGGKIREGDASRAGNTVYGQLVRAASSERDAETDETAAANVPTDSSADIESVWGRTTSESHPGGERPTIPEVTENSSDARKVQGPLKPKGRLFGRSSLGEEEAKRYLRTSNSHRGGGL